MLHPLGFIFCAMAALLVSSVAGQRNCSRDRLRQCSNRLLLNIQQRILNVNRQEMDSLCMKVRSDFNCLLRETRCLTSESEKNRNGDTLRNALRYIRDGCDNHGASWRESSCYVSDNMKACERSYPLGGSQYASYNPETCRKFNLFQDCVMDVVRTRCRIEDERLLGQYLVDSGQDLAWNCGDSSFTSAALSSWDSRSRDDDQYDRYDRNRDRDLDRDRDRGSSMYNRDWDSSYNRDRYSDRYSGGSLSYNRGYGNSDATCCRNERCSSSRMQQCKDSLYRAVDTSRTSGYQDEQKCRQTRDDFNCLLWQTSNCATRSERDQDNNLISRAKDFISKNCDTYGRWSENSCYKSTEMQRCEDSLPSTSTRSGATYDSCRKYLVFRDCMQYELQRRCTRDDELYQGAYLTDKAQELAWQCGNDHSQYNGRNQYFTENRRDPYDSSYGRYDSPEHLEDDDAMCQSRVQSYKEQCQRTLDDKRRKIYSVDDYSERQKINCCSARQYRACLYDATRRVCQSERSHVVNSFMGRYSFELSSDNCQKIQEWDCDSGTNYQVSLMLLLCTIIFPVLLQTYF